MATRKRQNRSRSWDVGRLIARALCALFALLGVLPLGVGFLVRSAPVRAWAARETARVVHELLGVEATYRVEVGLWPVEVALTHVVVAASDGGEPALTAKRIAVSPRLFPLLAGRLGVGDIAIDGAHARVVVRDGKIQNLDYKLPEPAAASEPAAHAPFSSIAMTDASASLDLDGSRIDTGLIDLDVYAEAGQSYEIALTAGESTTHQEIKNPVLAAATATPRQSGDLLVFDDVLCQLDARVRIEPNSVLVRRLSLLGTADFDPSAAGRAHCKLDEDQAGRIALRLSQLRVLPSDQGPPTIDGHILVRAPTELANRYLAAGPFQGWVGLSGTVHYASGQKLPEITGKFKSGRLMFGHYLLVAQSEGDLRVVADRIEVPHVRAGYADGTVELTDVRVEPFAPGAPLSIRRGENSGLTFPGLLRDIDVTPNTIVRWDLDKTVISDFHGSLVPPNMTGDLYAETSNFEVFDRAFHDPLRRHMIGVKKALVRGRFGVRPDSVQFLSTRAEFGKSRLDASVKIGFHNSISLDVADSSSLDLADISPLIDIPMKGTASLGVKMNGPMNDPLLSGGLAIQGLVFGGFPIGNISRSEVEFRPLMVKVKNLQGETGNSPFSVPNATLNFETDASVLAEATVKSDRLDIRDFFRMWHFDQDPRWDEIKGVTQTEASIRYALKGGDDPCRDGHLRVKGRLDFTELDLFEERYDRASANFDFDWIDPDASYLGFRLDVPSFVLQKGSGRILGGAHVDLDGKVQAHAIATGIPIGHIQGAQALGRGLRGEVSAVAEVAGNVDALAVTSSVQIGPVRVGHFTLPASELAIALVPTVTRPKTLGKSGCGRPLFGPFDRKEYDADRSAGVFHIDGQLFARQIHLDDLTITRQRAKRIAGKIAFNELDLAAIAELSPEIALAKTRPAGTLSGKLNLEALSMNDPGLARGQVAIDRLQLRYGGFHLETLTPSAFAFKDRTLTLAETELGARTPNSRESRIAIGGSINKLGVKPTADLSVKLEPTPFATFAELIPNVERASGELRGNLHLSGRLDQLRYDGGIDLTGGELSLRTSPLNLTDLDVHVALSTGMLRLERATMKLGGGTVSIHGSAPLRGFELGDASGTIEARDVTLTPSEGVRVAIDADLEASRKAEADSAKANLPELRGEVRLKSFQYSRPVTMTADLATLAQRGRRTEFESYDPESDFFSFNIAVRADKALRINNNLIDARLAIDSGELTLTGTNQRFGARGRLRLDPGGQIRLRSNNFEIREGSVEFDDPTELLPRVDVTAVTDYRRYSSYVAPNADGTGGAAGGGGQWHITLHAYGDAEKLRVDLTSLPELSEDDIFLLLTLGLTRAELDQAQSARLGESVALEALGSLTGADQAVTEAIPVIDEFRFGSAYSSRTGQTEPTVTIGKRLSDRIRTLITSGLSESREVRSNLEWRLSRRVSVEGSYDNVNDISSSSLGNIGTDIRWRLEFE